MGARVLIIGNWYNSRLSAYWSDQDSHGQEKGLELAGELPRFRNWRRSGDLQARRNILDVFAGSGTTLIAAEKAGRRGYGIEIDCHYTDIIIRRFDEVFGLKAVHAESKLDFERLTNERSKERRHGQKAKTSKRHRARGR